jgi:hypothetical protein
MPSSGGRMIGISKAIWHSDLKPQTCSEMLTLVRLGDFADQRGECYPKIARVARETGMSLRNVKRSIASLERQGFLDVSKTRERGARAQNTYRINLEKLGLSGDSLAPQGRTNWVPKMFKSGAKNVKPPAPPYRKNRQELSLETLRYRNMDNPYGGPEYQTAQVAS